MTPEIVFVFDPSVEYSIRLEGLIEETRGRSPATDDDDPRSPEPPDDG